MRLRLQIRIARLVDVSSHEKPTFGDGGVDGIFVPRSAITNSDVVGMETYALAPSPTELLMHGV